MANIAFNNQKSGFSMWLDEVMPEAIERSVDYLYFSTPNKHAVTFNGGPFAYSAQGLPVSGDVASIAINLFGNKSGVPDIQIDDLHVDISTYASLLVNGPTAADKTTLFWTATLSGNDSINFGTAATQAGFNINFAGDGNVAPGEAIGANDTLRGDVGAGIAVGDYFLVKLGQTAFGGNDDIRLEDSLGATVIGDFHTGELNGKLFAGDDFIQLGDLGSSAYGDAAFLGGGLDAGNDTILGGAGGDVLVGDVAIAYDTASFRSGDDEIHGGGGADNIYGDAGYAPDATFVGGNDLLFGDAGADSLSGGAGNDTLDGGADGDFLQGGLGNDVERGGAGQDSIYGGQGIDTADYRDKSEKVEIVLDNNGSGAAKVGGLVEDALDDIENLIGGKAGDKLVGNPSENRLEGAGGNDTLNGGSDQDTLVGGKGKDKLVGGTEADQFVFTAKLGSTNVDKIVDFVHGVDEIALDDAIFKALGTSFQKNEFVAKADGHAASKASQHVIYDKSDGTLWYDADGKGGKAAVQFAQLGSEANHPTNLAWDDFAIV